MNREPINKQNLSDAVAEKLREYIRSSDGSFVYGYALASDTGGFISGEEGVDVDLFYETYRESALNSLRTVDIYVLEWGNGTLYY